MTRLLFHPEMHHSVRMMREKINRMSAMVEEHRAVEDLFKQAAESQHTASVQHGPKGGRYVLTPSGKHYLGSK